MQPRRVVNTGFAAWRYHNLRSFLLYGTSEATLEDARDLLECPDAEFSPYNKDPSKWSMYAFFKNPIIDFSFSRDESRNLWTVVAHSLQGEHVAELLKTVSEEINLSPLVIPRKLVEDYEKDFLESEYDAYDGYSWHALRSGSSLEEHFALFHYTRFLMRGFGFDYEGAKSMASKIFRIEVKN